MGRGDDRDLYLAAHLDHMEKMSKADKSLETGREVTTDHQQIEDTF